MNERVLDERSIFLQAIEITSGEGRSAYLAEACGADRDLRAEVEELLRAHGTSLGLLDAPDGGVPTVEMPRGGEPVGTVIGPYELMEQIGEGGMGVVYVAEQSRPVRRRVALKVIKPGMDTRQVLARFEAERQALALMDHPNIAKVHDAGATDAGRPYFVMELVKGISVTDYCDKARLSIAERLELFVLVCRAVQHAHQKGVIHRDLKPTNILVTLVDGAAVPKVIDFGIAKSTGGALTDGTVYTGISQLVGTPLYMSPEQAELSGVDVDTRSDVYALGVLLYELLTGTTPLDRETLGKAAYDEVRRIVREQETPTPSTRLGTLGATLPSVSANRQSDARKLNHAVRGELDWIVMKALEKDRTRRYETANDFAADVMRHLTDRPVEACPPSAWYRFGKFARRNRVALTTASIVSAALIGGGVISVWQAIRATRAERRAETRYELARRAVDEMYTQVAEKWLKDQPALTTLQRDFLEKALAFYEQFGFDAGSDPRARQEVLEALYRAGVIRHRLGQHAEAETALRRVVALGTDLVRQFPDRPEFRLVLAEARLKLANLHRDIGKPFAADTGTRITFSNGGTAEYKSAARRRQVTEAEQEVRLASLELAEMRTMIPIDAAYRRRLAEAQEALCEELTLARQLPEAEAAVQAAFGIWASLVKDYPDETEHHLGLARNYSRQGMNFMWWGGQNEKAEAALRQADTLLSKLQKERPGDPRPRRSLSGVLQNLGVILGWTKRYDDAEMAARRAVTLLESLTTDFPDVLEYQDSLGSALNNQARAIASQGQLIEQGRDNEIEKLDRRALAIRENLADRHPDVPDYESNLASSLRSLSYSLSRQGKVGEARQVLERAILRARAYLKAHPERRDNSMLANALNFLAPVEVERGDHAAAVQAAEEWSRLIIQSSFAPDKLGEVVSSLGEDVLKKANEAVRDARLSPQRREAIVQAQYLQFKALTLEAARRAPENSRTLFLLSDSLTTAPEGLRAPELALRLAEKAFELKPEDGMTWQSLGWAHYRVGDWKRCIESLEKQNNYPGNGDYFAAMAYWQLGDQAGARELFDRTDKWLAGYEKRWNETIYPSPTMMRRIRAEAATLLGVTNPDTGKRPESTPNGQNGLK